MLKNKGGAMVKTAKPSDSTRLRGCAKRGPTGATAPLSQRLDLPDRKALWRTAGMPRCAKPGGPTRHPKFTGQWFRT